MNERYQVNKMRPVTDALITAQNAITAIVAQNDEENIFDYRKDNPELYKLYMEINDVACKAFEMYNN